VSEPVVPQRLVDSLEPGERLIWWGQPRQGFILRSADLYLIPFSIFWGGIAVFNMYFLGNTPNAPGFAILVQAILTIVAVYLVIGRFFYDAWRRSRLVYGLTDRRILLVSPGNRGSFALESLSDIELDEARSGRGSITLGRRRFKKSLFWTSEMQEWAAWAGRPVDPTLERIPEARGVFAAIREAQSAVRARPQSPAAAS
jgi:hypothetical protein